MPAWGSRSINDALLIITLFVKYENVSLLKQCNKLVNYLEFKYVLNSLSL